MRSGLICWAAFQIRSFICSGGGFSSSDTGGSEAGGAQKPPTSVFAGVLNELRRPQKEHEDMNDMRYLFAVWGFAHYCGLLY